MKAGVEKKQCSVYIDYCKISFMNPGHGKQIDFEHKKGNSKEKNKILIDWKHLNYDSDEQCAQKISDKHRKM